MIASAPSSSCSDSESTVTSTMSERSSLASLACRRLVCHDNTLCLDSFWLPSILGARLAPEDTITNWGVLVGKALWCRMKGTTHMTERHWAERARECAIERAREEGGRFKQGEGQSLSESFQNSPQLSPLCFGAQMKAGKTDNPQKKKCCFLFFDWISPSCEAAKQNAPD